MTRRSVRRQCLSAVASFAIGCGTASPPPPPPPPVAKPVEKPLAKPPPPCEAMEERCEAKAGTRARIAQSQLSFTPPPSWTYAQETDATVAGTGEGGAALALTGYVSADAKKQTADRDAALAALMKKLGVTPPKKLVWKKKPDDKMKVGAFEVSLWQFDGSARGAKKGPMLVFSAPLPESHVLLGLAFVPNDDAANSDAAILEAVKSIAASEAPPPSVTP